MTKKSSRRILAVMMAMVMTMAMMFAMTTTSFAATGDTVTVTVKFDTRSYDLNGQMKKTDGTTLVSASPVVTYTNVTDPAGSSALAAVQKAASDNGFAVQTKRFGGSNVAITDIGQVGENHLSIAQLENSFIRLGTGADAYTVSGWVYGITPVGSTEFFPYDYMNAYTVSDGMTVSMHYSVTGPYDVNTQNWTADYSNPDVTMWNLYDQVTDKIATATDPDAAALAEYYQSTIYGEIAASKTATGNTTGWSAYYFSHNGLTDTNQAIPTLQDVLTWF